MKNKIRVGDKVKLKETRLIYIVDGSINGATYNDGEQDWVNVKCGFNPIDLLSFPLKELKLMTK